MNKSKITETGQELGIGVGLRVRVGRSQYEVILGEEESIRAGIARAPGKVSPAGRPLLRIQWESKY